MARIIRFAWSIISHGWFLERDPFDVGPGRMVEDLVCNVQTPFERMQAACHRVQDALRKTAVGVYCHA